MGRRPAAARRAIDGHDAPARGGVGDERGAVVGDGGRRRSGVPLAGERGRGLTVELDLDATAGRPREQGVAGGRDGELELLGRSRGSGRQVGGRAPGGPARGARRPEPHRPDPGALAHARPGRRRRAGGVDPDPRHREEDLGVLGAGAIEHGPPDAAVGRDHGHHDVGRPGQGRLQPAQRRPATRRDGEPRRVPAARRGQRSCAEAAARAPHDEGDMLVVVGRDRGSAVGRGRDGRAAAGARQPPPALAPLGDVELPVPAEPAQPRRQHVPGAGPALPAARREVDRDEDVGRRAAREHQRGEHRSGGADQPLSRLATLGTRWPRRSLHRPKL